MSEESVSHKVWRQNILCKFDLILHHADGWEYDENGCHGCFPCIPLCRKPAYEAGQSMTGYLILRPSRSTVITGVSVIFGGRTKTHWREGTMHWGSENVFYKEVEQIVVNRPIELECKWYRFEFEHRIPNRAPTSFKEPEGKLEYYACGVVTTIEGTLIETFDSHFHVIGFSDIDTLPPMSHKPLQKQKTRTYPTSHDYLKEKSLEAEELPSDIISGQVTAILGINCQAFVANEHLITDVSIENDTDGELQASLKFLQIIIFRANQGWEEKQNGKTTFQSMVREKTTRRELAVAMSFTVPPRHTEACSKMLNIPDLVPSTPRKRPILPGCEATKEPDMQIKYHIELVLKPYWDADEIFLPFEIKIGNQDSRTRGSTSQTFMLNDTPKKKKLAFIDAPPPSYVESSAKKSSKC